MATEDKFQASEEFDAGMRKALFGMNPPNNIPFQWEACSQVFLDGYKFGIMIEAKNQSLVENGFRPIECLELQFDLALDLQSRK